MAKTEGKQLEILKHHRKNGYIFVIVVFFDIDAVEQDFPLCRIIQTAQQFDKGGLSAAIHADDRKPRSHAKPYGHMPQGIYLGSRVFERHVPKLDFIIVVAAFAEGALFNGKGTLIHRVGHINVFEDFTQINIIVFQLRKKVK